VRRTGPEVEPDLAVLTQALHPRLVGLLALYTGDRHLAEDLAQETLIRLHQHWPSVQAHPSPEAWASRVAINLAGSWWRRRGAERRANQKVDARRSPLPVDHADVLAVRSAVGALSRRHRAVVVLRFYQGLSVRETAEVLGCPEGTVKSQTSSAIAELRRTLGDLDVPDQPNLSIPMETFHA
jgi:RNA polymerase sigma-70 factor (ECF subfamily)